MLDASHLHLLARTVQSHLGLCGEFFSILDCHSCGGLRDVVSSTTCVDRECFRRDGGDGPRLSNYLDDVGYDAFTSRVRVVDDSEITWTEAEVDTGDHILVLDIGELSLASVWGQSDEAMIALNDESAFEVLIELAASGSIEASPIRSLELVRLMYMCGALTADVVEMICSQVEADVQGQPDMSDRVRKVKLEYAAFVQQDVALAEAKRAMAPADEAS